MKNTTTPFNLLFCITGVLMSFTSYAINSKLIEEKANTSIKKLYHTLSSIPNTSMAERIDWISNSFKGTTYILGSLGEGPNARYDQFPRYRVDGFDCDTYVNTVLALALANSLHTFQQCLNYTRYKNGSISYLNRNHFTSVDWNANNQQRGLLKDITLSIKDEQKHTVALYANTVINKSGWYAHKKINTIRLQHENKIEQEHRLAELKAKGIQQQSIASKVPYLPLTVLFLKNGEPNLYLFSQIPSGSIIEIVRPDWDLTKLIGTSLNISHLGFAIKVNDHLYFREASSEHGKIIDIPLIEYLKSALKSPTIKGINVQIVVPEKPITDDCRTFVTN